MLEFINRVREHFGLLQLVSIPRVDWIQPDWLEFALHHSVDSVTWGRREAWAFFTAGDPEPAARALGLDWISEQRAVILPDGLIDLAVSVELGLVVLDDAGQVIGWLQPLGDPRLLHWVMADAPVVEVRTPA